ncbi:hypothetical protein VP01_2770g1 [Puccinia sorghi]|uniref:Uncharacterized protein n=1 Tax=Puccinia sorghi TaxID=27349 RepID=A0A0L6V2U4_9BASI|nr:hypothetical protein VP01_2770g1 [Puccinia sorghi]
MSEPASNINNTKSDQTIDKKLTTDSGTMEKIDLIYLKLAINAVPVLTQEIFSIWHTRILNYFDILRIKDYFLEGKGTISEDDAQNVQTILTAKVDAAVHANVITLTKMMCYSSGNAKSAIEKLHEVGINCDVDIIAYKIMKKLPKTPVEYNGISTAITHSGSTVTPELVLDHLRLHANQQAIEGSSFSN